MGEGGSSNIALSELSPRFTYQGHIFFNISESGTQGESYLLNQQFSNIKLATNYQFTDTTKFHGLFLYNHFPTPIMSRFFVEQAFIAKKFSAWNMQIGKEWIPFGKYKNTLIYKPLTKALGQTNDHAITLSYGDQYYSSLTVFHPRTMIKSSSLPAYYNLNIGMYNDQYDIGASYLYSIADSQLFQYNKGFGGFVYHNIKSHVPGIATYFNWKYKNVNTYITYVSAVQPFLAHEISYQNKGAAPSAFSIQSNHTFQLKHIPLQAVVFGDYTREALALRLPEKRIGVGLNIYPSKYLDVQFQYFKDYPYSQHTIASGLNTIVSGNKNINNTLALQLVVNLI